MQLPAVADEFRKYAIVATLSFVSVLGIAAALHEIIGIGERVAVAITLLVALCINFTLLRRFVFPGQVAGLTRQFVETVIVSLSFRGIEYLIFLGLNLGLGTGYLLAIALALCISNIGKFTVWRHVVFNRSRGPARVPVAPG